MTKKNKIVIIILAVILVITGVFAVLTLNKGFVSKITGSLDADSGTADMSEFLADEFKSDYPLVQTQQKDIFYVPCSDGTIKYYTFTDGAFIEKTDGISQKDITIPCSYQDVKVKVYYFKSDVGTIGYGLFNVSQDTDVKFFSYVFVRMIDCPSSYSSTARTDYVLLTDMDAGDSYKADKTYSDIYSYDMSSGKVTLVMSQRDRPVDSNGAFRQDWSIYTDASVNSMKKSDLFASARNYDINSDSITYDFLSVVNSRSMQKSSAATVVGSPSYNIWEKDGEYYCFINTDNGFDLVKNKDTKNPLKSFTGSFSEYAVSGNWILNKSTLEFTNVFTGETKSCKKATFTSLSGFIANDSGTKFILFCQSGKQSMILYDTESGKAKIVTDNNIFDSGICNFCFIDDSTFIVSSYDESKSSTNKICKF